MSADLSFDMDLRDLYQDLILDHGKKPRNFRCPPTHNRESLGHNPVCGDKLVLYLTVDASDKIEDAAFQGTGCAISLASASMMTEMVKGRSRDEAERLFSYFHALCTGGAPTAMIDATDQERLQALAGVRHFPVRVKCATLAWHTMQNALAANEEKVSPKKVSPKKVSTE
jgi:nitrogen fixation protein NifU and related proteins